jgi:hypothetical protein
MSWMNRNKKLPPDESLKAQVARLQNEVDTLNLMVGLPQVELTAAPGPVPSSALGWVEAALGLADGYFMVRNIGFSAVYRIELSPIVTVANPNPQGKDFEIRQVQPDEGEGQGEIEGLERGEEAPQPGSIILEVVDAKPTDLRLEFRTVGALASKEEKPLIACVDGVGALQRHDVIGALMWCSKGLKVEALYPVTLKATNIRGDVIETEYDIVFRPWMKALSCRFKTTRIAPAGSKGTPAKEYQLGEGGVAQEAARTFLSQQQVKEGVGIWISAQKS